MERNYNRRYTREYNLGMSCFYRLFLWFVVDRVFQYCYKYTIQGKENIPKGSSRFIYAANHVSTLDPPAVGFVIRHRIAFMAKAELFDPKDPFMKWLVTHLGAFAVNRSKPEISTFKTVKDIFKTDWALGVFPQGGTFPYGKPINVKKGFAVIAKKAEADVIPIAIANFSDYPKGFGFKKQKFDVYIGKPISHELSEDEIIEQWKNFILEHADYPKE